MATASELGATPAFPSDFQPVGAMRAAGESVAPVRAWRFTAPDGTRAEVALLAADLACVQLLPLGIAPAPSWAVVAQAWPVVDVRVTRDADGGLLLTTAAMRVAVRTAPWRIACSWPDGVPFAEDDAALGTGLLTESGTAAAPATPQGARCYKRLAPAERILGCGERTGGLDHRGERLTFYNVDPLQPHGAQTDSMYISIPFWLGVRNGRTYGVFLDSAYRTRLDVSASHPDRLHFDAAGGDLTYYIFAGPTPAAVLARYADLTGHMPLPPRWALGYGQSRWSYYPESEVRAIAAELRARRIPCDSLWLDIDYLDAYRVFTWDPRRFPQPRQLLRDLAEAGFKVVTILDPGVKADPADETYRDGLAHDAFVRRADGTPYTGAVWPGEAAFPDFSRADVRAWWGERHRMLLDDGVAGIWDDMNEPTLTDVLMPQASLPYGASLPPDAVHRPDGPDGPPLPHAAFHNAYGLEMARATREALERLRPNQRAFVLTRAGCAGVQRYAAVWTGDNTSDWANLRMALRMCLALGLSGVPFVGFDTGGFWGDATGELLVRFTQLGALFPLFRNHSAVRTHAQEPWAFGHPFEGLCRAAIELRYRLLPYLYTLCAQSARDGSPLARPLVYAYPAADALATIDDEVLLGGDLLAAPVCAEAALVRDVWLPPGTWRAWHSGARRAGPVRVAAQAPLDTLPLYAREGSIVPLGPVMQYVGERSPDPLTLAIYLGPEPGARAAGTLYEDDGETLAYQHGAWRRTRWSAECTEGVLRLRAEDETGGHFATAPRDWLAEFHLPLADASATRPDTRIAVLEGRPEVLNGARELRRAETVLRVPLGRVAPPLTLRVELA